MRTETSWRKCLCLLAASVLVLVVCLVTGCGSKEEDAGGRTIITLPTTGGDRMEKMYAEMIPAFEKAHPDVKVKRMDVPGSYYIKLQIMIAAGSAPDLAPMMTMRLPMFLYRNAFLPLNDLMQADNEFQARKSDIYEKTWSGFEKDGKLYGLAYSQNLYAVYYNKTIFDTYNKTAPEGEKVEYPNSTWDLDKFVEVAKKLTLDTDGDGRIDQYGTISSGTPFYVTCPILRRFGLELFNPEKTKCNLDRPEAIEAMQWYFDLPLKYHVAPSPVGPDARSVGAVAGGPQEMFMAGRVAMWEAESEWRFEFNKKIKSFEWDIGEPPHGRFKAAGFECFGMSITASSKHPKEAWKFIGFLTSPEGQKILLKHEIGIPVLKSLCQSPEYFLNPKDLPAHKEVYLKTLEYGEDIPSLRNFQEVESAISDQLDWARIGKKPTEECCKAAAREADKLLEENKD